MAHPIYSDFTGGEISPRAAGRVDLPLYQKSCRIIENFIVLVQGGVERRPGLLHVHEVESSAAKSRLVPWEEPNGRLYFIELCNTKINIYREDTQALVHSITTSVPWLTAELFDVCPAFDGNKTMMFTNRGWTPHRLVHNTPTNDTDWTLDEPTFTIVGYTDTNLFKAADHYPHLCFFFGTRFVLACSNVAPNYIWLSCAQNLVTGTDRYTDFTLNTALPEATGFNEALGFAINAYASRGGTIRWIKGRDTLVAGTTAGELSFGNGERGLTPAYPGDIKGTTFYGGSAGAIVAGDAVIFLQKGKKHLREMLTNEQGAYIANDLCIAATHIGGDEGFTSELEFASVPDPIILAVRADGELALMTYERALEVMAWQRFVTDGLFESIAVATKSTEVDAVWCIVKRTINGATKRYIERFAPRDWTALRDCFFVDCGLAINNGAAKDITGVVLEKPIRINSTAHGFADGNKVRLASLLGTLELNDQVFTVDSPAADYFYLHTEEDTADVDGTLVRVSFALGIPASWAAGDTLTGSPSGATATLVAIMDATTVIAGAASAYNPFATDTSVTNGTTPAATPVSTPLFTTYISGGTAEKVQKVVTGLSHLEAKTVQILGDGAVIPEEVVASGQITMDSYANKIAVGLPFTSMLMPMPLEAGQEEGTAQGRRKRIDRVTGRFYRSLGCRVGPDEDHLVPLLFREADAEMGVATDPFTGDIEVPFPGDFDTTGDLLIVQDEPLPLNLVAIMPRLRTNE